MGTGLREYCFSKLMERRRAATRFAKTGRNDLITVTIA
jgi:hypothetical protein